MRRFQPVASGASLSEKVIRQVRDAIANNEYKPGDRLPSENELAEAFQISRTSVREAMKVLAGQGLVEIRRGLGAFVTQPSESTLMNRLQESVLSNKDNLLELSLIRKVLETEAAAWAAEKATPDDIAKLQEIVDLAAQAAANPATASHELNSLNARFHFHMVQATGNRTLQRIMNDLIDTLTQAREITLQFPGRYTGSVDGHRAVLAAIKKRDGRRAKSAMLKHLEAVEGTILYMAEGKSANLNNREEKE